MIDSILWALAPLWWIICALVGAWIWFKPDTCKLFGWHDRKGGALSFDGCSMHASCTKCGKEVMQDGQGNWF